MRVYLLVLAGFICNALAAQQKEIVYLSGTGSDHTVQWDFYCTGGRNSGHWTQIAVPSCWEQQGFGSYNYGRDYKTYGKNFRFADEKGIYRHAFSVPASWKGKEVYIVFEGSMTDTEVRINGQPAGATHRGAFYRFKYNITGKLKYGVSNKLEAEVSKMSSDVSVNNAERLADYWIFGGIFRPVYLEVVNKEFIDYVAVDAKADGLFRMQVFPKNISKPKTVTASIIDAKGAVIKTISQAIAAGDTVTTLQTQVKQPLQWTSETPNLYRVLVSLKEKNRTVYTMKERFGFRTIEVRHGDGIYINGVQVKMKGINRHCFWPETGRTLNDSVQLLDARLIKQMNMNAVRCSHYPPDQRFLELCDSMGLYVLDELAGWQKAYGTEAGKPLVREMVVKDLNHPSIIFWDNGNEGGTNKNLDAEFSRWDFSNRPVIHPHHRPGNAFNGIDCNHYEDYYSTKKNLEDSLIYMPTEYLHSQDDGGGGSAMYDFWNLHWKAKRSGGGFIWAMLDEGVVRTDMNNIVDADGLNANDGVLGPHRQKEGSFYALRAVFAPVRIELTELPENFKGAIEMENRYHFTDLNANTYKWELVRFKGPFDPAFTGYTVENSGTAQCPPIKPLQKGMLQLGLPADFKNYDALVLTATDGNGDEIYKWTWKIKTNAQLLDTVWGHEKRKNSVAENDSLITLKSDGLELTLNKSNGRIKSIQNKELGMDQLLFNNGPILVQGTSRVKGYAIKNERDDPSVVFSCDGNMKAFTWTMQSNGWVRLDYEYALNGSYPFAGISFNFPENYVLGAKWLGKGPYRQWKNRSWGIPVNVWKNFYNNTQTSYAPLVYPEFKGYYGAVTWMELNTVQGKFYVASKDDGLYVRLFNFYGLTGVKPFPELPVGDISFLDCIPPMGTKLALNQSTNTAVLGPGSELTKIDKPVKRSLYFYFGLPKISDTKEQYSRPKIDNVF
ncbi:glycoside hydrolase family 2 protein [Niabella soli]|uniref:Beta-galactosidase n=1 Tax=Niabella soli DSM 19437 TaxID=929713 RepID=W0EWH2_9BACT|nr:glycoside hydrolase family 2 [Niabella soli]AHF15140.1 glycoside hydrolase [Niabella soli DSM 19437]